MFWYDFSFRSLTAAQDGRSVLEHAGIGAELLRAPQAISEQGCGYVVETADFEGARAFEQFLANGVRFRRVFRRYETGMVEEAGLLYWKKFYFRHRPAIAALSQGRAGGGASERRSRGPADRKGAPRRSGALLFSDTP